MLLWVLAWFIVLELYTLAALPLSYRVFSRLPSNGIVFAKPLGLLGAGFAVWVIGLTHTIPNSRWSVLLALAVLAGVSALAVRGRRPELWRALRASTGLLLAAEMVFIAAFIGVVLLRASTPDISHTEQPMDLMFLNAVIVSPHYPPNDPWLAGAQVSYYYLGYLMIGSVAMLTGAAASVAYNLGLATAAAIGAVAAFGLTFDLVRLARGSREAAIRAGLAAVFLLLIASNLVGALELGRAAGAGDEAFWESVGIQGLTAAEPSSSWYPDDAFWWWWRASRAIPGAIAEFPAFSFVLGDLHPHVMSIGFVLLMGGIAIQVYLQQGLLQAAALWRHWPLLLVIVVSLGSLAAANLWDLPLGLALVGGAVMLNAARNERRGQFGRAVAMTDDLMVIGAVSRPQSDEDLLRVRLYRLRDGRWRQAQKLNAYGLGANADFGASVAAGERAVAVGAPKAGGTGVVYVYEPSGRRWANAAVLTPPETEQTSGFGASVAVSGDCIAVAGRSAVYLFERGSGAWPLRATIRPLAAPDTSGMTAALQGDTLVIGAPAPSGGVVDVYARSATGWKLEKTFGARPVGIRRFGVSISLHADHIAVGGEDAVAVYRRSRAGWAAEAVMRPPKPSYGTFGAAVGVSLTHLVAGASKAGGQAPKAGSAFVFVRTQQGWEYQQELTVEDTGVDSVLGSAAAVRGDTIALGAPGGGQGGVYTFRRTFDKWELAKKIVGRWRLGRAVLTLLLLTGASLAAAAPFLLSFESRASGILPLREIVTRPLHLLLVWGVPGFLAASVFAQLIRRIFTRGTWGLARFSVAMLAAFMPVAFWLQPFYGPIAYAFIALSFAVHQLGYRLPRSDEAVFAYNPRVTLLAVGFAVTVGFIIEGVINSERAADGEILAIDRLLIVIPMAAVIGLAIYGAWTFAHRDSEALRLGASASATRWNAHVPILLILATASALIMGADLFHVSDVFGGALRRQNTVFKLYYQAWLLLAVIGGYGLWYAGRRWNRRRLGGRIGVTLSAALLLIGFGAVSYYPFAAVTTRVADRGALDLDGLAYLERHAPADYALVRWVQANTPRDAVVLEGARVPCSADPSGCTDWDPALGRVAYTTGRPTVLGWEGHELQWRREGFDFAKRQRDVRTIYETPDAAVAAALVREYGIDYVVVSSRERAVYGASGLAKFDALGSAAFEAADITLYRIEAGGAA